jgi:hypothetical protein
MWKTMFQTVEIVIQHLVGVCRVMVQRKGPIATTPYLQLLVVTPVHREAASEMRRSECREDQKRMLIDDLVQSMPMMRLTMKRLQGPENCWCGN